MLLPTPSVTSKLPSQIGCAISDGRGVTPVPEVRYEPTSPRLRLMALWLMDHTSPYLRHSFRSDTNLFIFSIIYVPEVTEVPEVPERSRQHAAAEVR